MSLITEETALKLIESLDALAEETYQLRLKLNEGIDINASASDTIQSLTYQLKQMNTKK